MSKNWEIHSHHEQSLPYSIVAVIAWRRSVCLCWMCGIYCWVRLSRTTGSIVNTWLRLFGGIQPPRLVSVLPETRFAWQILLSNKDISLKFILFFERREKHLQFASTTTVEVLYAETFSEWLSAVWSCSSVWGRNLSSPNYHQLHSCMDGKEKKTVNGNWYTNAWITWLLCSGRYILHVSWALCSEQISVRNSYVEEGYFFLFPRSDLLLPVNSCECVAQDFLSICKSKKFFFPFFPPVSFAYTLSLRERMRMREWQVKKPSLQLELIWRSRSSAFSREVDLRKRRG